jgi:hypothetical protein
VIRGVGKCKRAVSVSNQSHPMRRFLWHRRLRQFNQMRRTHSASAGDVNALRTEIHPRFGLRLVDFGRVMRPDVCFDAYNGAGGGVWRHR